MTSETIRPIGVRIAIAQPPRVGGRTEFPSNGDDQDAARESVLGQFKELIAAGAAAPPPRPAADPFARTPAAPDSAAREALSPPTTTRPSAAAVAPEPFAAASVETRAPRSAWFYRMQGAAFVGGVALAGLAAARLPVALDAGLRASPPVTASADPSAAFADAFAQTARIEAAPSPSLAIGVAVENEPADGGAAVSDAPDAEVVARIAAADPPYRVVLNVAPGANPRDVARLDTAIKAWGFVEPEQRVAAEPVALPEVVFHAPQDREAALIVARIADRILAEAVLTPPGGQAPAPASAGLIEINVTTR